MIYFTNVAFLTWISIISYDTYIALTGFSYYALFRIYFTVGLITPILTTLLVWAAEQSSMEDGFKPGIQIGSCAVQSEVFQYFQDKKQAKKKYFFFLQF